MEFYADAPPDVRGLYREVAATLLRKLGVPRKSRGMPYRPPLAGADTRDMKPAVGVVQHNVSEGTGTPPNCGQSPPRHSPSGDAKFTCPPIAPIDWRRSGVSLNPSNAPVRCVAVMRARNT